MVLKSNPQNMQETDPDYNLNFKDNTGNFFIHGTIDDSLPKNIISPLIQEIDARAVLKTKPPIRIFITSRGGNLYPCFDIIAAFEYAKSKEVPIHTVVTSYAASAGSLIAVCGHKRFVGTRAYHLLHFARIWTHAHNPEMQERNHENSKWMQAELVKVYSTYTKIKDVKAKLLADNYMINGGKELIKLGLADELF